ncbi:MAG: capsule assembly Wzi family protein, partial [candidate division WOR-3 bacterium]|nr:capsule assembly Wzi family protein [candidate division WOR-3 bacterium]
MSLVLLISLIIASFADDVPTNFWTYKALDYLYTTGYLNTIPPTSKPYSTLTVKRLLSELDLTTLPGNSQTAFYLNRLKSELDYQALVKINIGSTNMLYTPIIRLTHNNFSSRYTPQGLIADPQNNLASLGFKLSFDSTAPISFYHLSWATFRMRRDADTWDPAGRHYPNTRYKSYTDYFAFETPVAYISFPMWFLKAKIGRDYLEIGPAYRSSVILSCVPLTLDQILIKAEAKNYKILWFVAGLSRWHEYQRYLSGQRGELSITRYFRLGGTMLVVWSPDSLQTRSFFGYLNPLVPLYLEKSITGDEDNVLMGLDLSLTLKNLKFYGALLIDNYEFNQQPNRPPNCYGLSYGIYLPYKNFALRSEYSKVTRYTYYHRIYHIAYTHYSVPLGHSLGPDADELFCQGEFYPHKTLRIALIGLLVRRGDGNRGSLEHKTWDANEIPIREFPSRPIE